jgi:Helitron helicase-like domain at N-terminus
MEDERLRPGKRREALDFPGDEEAADEDDESVEAFSLPASFTGSPNTCQKVADSLALARQRGKPDLMVTTTCNPNWPEIQSQLRPGQSACEAPQITQTLTWHAI